MEDTQPGQVISPRRENETEALASAEAPTSSIPPNAPTASVDDLTVLSAQSRAEQASLSQPLPSEPYSKTEQSPTTIAPAVPVEEHTAIQSVSNDTLSDNRISDEMYQWDAPTMFLQDPKGLTWYGLYLVGAVTFGIVVYLFTHDVISTAAVFLAVIGLVVFASRRPREVTYAIGEGMVSIGQRRYSLEDFKSFSFDEHGSIVGITLWPLKRFMPPITLYSSDTQKQVVADSLSGYLPLESHQTDAIDSLLRRIHIF